MQVWGYSCDARTLSETRVWGSEPESLPCFSATAPLKIKLRWGCEECSGKSAVGSGVAFKYDPVGRRIYKSSSSGTTIYAYDGDNDIEEVNSSGSVVARYTQTQNSDEPLAESRSSTTSFYEQDGLGSVTSLTNGSGSIANAYTYDSFGKLTASSGSITNPFRYTGRDFDSETSLQYNRARYYDPLVGRFISEDIIGFDGGIDFYSYANNSPMGFKDPLGLDTYGWPTPGSSTPIPRPGGPPPRKKPYNCMAYALGDTRDWMQPPTGVPIDSYMKQHGCKQVPCDSVEPCGKRHRVNTYEDPLEPQNWHVERQDCDGSWSGKNGQGPLVIGIPNPDDYYQRIYGHLIPPKKTCWSCKGN